MSTVDSSTNKVPTAATGVTSMPGSGVTLAAWRLRGIGILRIVFGLVWLIDAWFKWQPDFINGITDYLSGSLEGQPAAVQAWITFWLHTVHIDPTFFAYATAVLETVVAVGLLFGIFSNLTNIGGLLLSVIIWSTAEGFGGPYTAGSTDIGAAIIYALVFVALFFANAGIYLGLDRYLTPRLGRLGFLAAAPIDPPIAAG
jgi:thiosulfate dehydrogenase (quinone) large subunit